MHTRSTRHLQATLVICGFLLTGCTAPSATSTHTPLIGTGSSTAATDDPSAAPAASADDPTGARAAASTPLPLDAYELRDQGKMVAAAEQMIAAKCMTKLGFTPLPVAPDEPIDYVDTPNLTTGYHWVPTDTADLIWQAAIARFQALPEPSAAYTAAYTGTAHTSTGGVGGRDGGCLGQAELAVGGIKTTLSGVDPLVKQIDLATYARTDADPRVRQVAAQWAACMRAAGYNYGYTTPLDAAQDPRWGNTPNATPAELQTARTDIACQTRYRYFPIHHDVDAQYQKIAISQHIEALTDIKNAITTEIRNAAIVLQNH